MTEVLSGVRVVELASWTYVPVGGRSAGGLGRRRHQGRGRQRQATPGGRWSSAGSPRRPPAPTSTSSWRSATAASAASPLDVKSDTGREYFGRLLATADVFLTNWLPGAAGAGPADGRGHPLVQSEHHHRARHRHRRARTGPRQGRLRRGHLPVPRRGVLHDDAVRHRDARRAGTGFRRPAGRDHARGRSVCRAVPSRAHRRAVASSTRPCWPRRCGRSPRRSRSPTSSTSTASPAHRPVWRSTHSSTATRRVTAGASSWSSCSPTGSGRASATGSACPTSPPTSASCRRAT